MALGVYHFQAPMLGPKMDCRPSRSGSTRRLPAGFLALFACRVAEHADPEAKPRISRREEGVVLGL